MARNAATMNGARFPSVTVLRVAEPIISEGWGFAPASFTQTRGERSSNGRRGTRSPGITYQSSPYRSAERSLPMSLMTRQLSTPSLKRYETN